MKRIAGRQYIFLNITCLWKTGITSPQGGMQWQLHCTRNRGQQSKVDNCSVWQLPGRTNNQVRGRSENINSHLWIIWIRLSRNKTIKKASSLLYIYKKRKAWVFEWTLTDPAQTWGLLSGQFFYCFIQIRHSKYIFLWKLWLILNTWDNTGYIIKFCKGFEHTWISGP